MIHFYTKHKGLFLKLFCVFSLLSFDVAAETQKISYILPGSEGENALIDKLQVFLNGFETLNARFTEVRQGYKTRSGEVWISRKAYKTSFGRFKFLYDAPDQTEIIADGELIWVIDKANGNKDSIGIENTPAYFLLKPKINLKDPDLSRTIREEGNKILLKITKKGDEEGMSLEVLFDYTHKFLVIQGWTITDHEGQKTSITLTNVQQKISVDESIFKVKN